MSGASWRAELFRIFFPLGVLAGISGVSLLRLSQFYPGVMHARLMVEGFLAAVILGFPSTAPRMRFL